ncbi:hypothetical protein F4779DRAFT_569918 [Xylariaceae sp. FL0662B]|nr:hypothetical protein F4779DRAFT_569918 [Xylariaceae sp. FL0662B]
MAPIRTAIIGLSASSVSSWASSAHLPYLLSPEGKAKYEIIALCNSSVEAAKRAIEAYKLPPGTRAYGSPADLAADPDVQFVVCSTRVDRHYETVFPSVQRGKDVYVEWPLAENAIRAGELAALARQRGGKTVVGLQGWFSAPAVKVREVIGSGRIGKVLSSEVLGFGGTTQRDVLPVGLKYFTERKIGGNIFTIGFGHLFDTVQFVLGEVQNEQSRLQIQRPDVKIRDPSKGDAIVETVKSDVPDLIIVTGSLPKSEHVVENATLLVRLRRGQPFKDAPTYTWTVYGEKGELRLTIRDGPMPHMCSKGNPLTLELYDFETENIESLEWESNERSELPGPARNIGALYEAYASSESVPYPTFEHAWKRHKQLDGILANFSA